MDLANVSSALSTLSAYDASSSVSQGSLAYAVGTAVLDNQLEMNEELNASMIRMMEQSVTPHLGGNIDVYA
ncbi:MAG: YjfB family protein [Clostridiales bacterium]|nr:YjfB family protein [Clostridiales bacterium]